MYLSTNYIARPESGIDRATLTATVKDVVKDGVEESVQEVLDQYVLDSDLEETVGGTTVKVHRATPSDEAVARALRPAEPRPHRIRRQRPQPRRNVRRR